MKKILLAICIAFGVISMTTTAEARGCGPCGPGGWGRGPGGGWCRPCPPPPPCGPGGCRPWGPPPPCGPGDWWGRGGRNFWPGFAAGAIGAIVGNAISQPTVVAQPTYVVPAQTVVAPQPVTYAQPTYVVQPAYSQSYQQTTIIQQPARCRGVPLVGANVNVLGVNVGASVNVGVY